jgi:hypothetical protein
LYTYRCYVSPHAHSHDSHFVHTRALYCGPSQIDRRT